MFLSCSFPLTLLAAMSFGATFVPIFLVSHSQDGIAMNALFLATSMCLTFGGAFVVGSMPYDPLTLVAFAHGFVVPCCVLSLASR